MIDEIVRAYEKRILELEARLLALEDMESFYKAELEHRKDQLEEKELETRETLKSVRPGGIEDTASDHMQIGYKMCADEVNQKLDLLKTMGN